MFVVLIKRRWKREETWVANQNGFVVRENIFEWSQYNNNNAIKENLRNKIEEKSIKKDFKENNSRKEFCKIQLRINEDFVLSKKIVISS